jgi:hypothetical protein
VFEVVPEVLELSFLSEEQATNVKAERQNNKQAVVFIFMEKTSIHKA